MSFKLNPLSSIVRLLGVFLPVLATASGTGTPAASFMEFDRRARAREPLVIVFFGGSLTWGANASDPQLTSYRALMADYLRQKYPKAPFTFCDAAIGGTGSKLGIFRLKRDVLSRKPDLVFLDFTCNDGLDGGDKHSLGSYEGLLRELIGKGIPVVQAFFCFKDNFTPYSPEKLHGYQERKKLVDLYQTGGGDALAYIQKKVSGGEANLDTLWGIDPGHPDDPGYQLFFEAMRDGFEQAIREKRVCALPLQPVYSDAYHQTTRRLLVNGPLPKGWTRSKTYRTSLWFDGLSSRWMDDVAMCDIKDQAVIQPLKVDFKGTLVGLFGEADQDGLGFKVFIDGKGVPYAMDAKTPKVAVWNFTPPGAMIGRLFVWRALADDLAPGPHTLEVVPVFPEGASKGQLRIESVCFAGE